MELPHASDRIASQRRLTRPKPTLEALARRISREAARALGASSAGIYLDDNDPRVLGPLATHPKQLFETLCQAPLAVGDLRALGAILSEHEPTLWTDDAPSDPRFQHRLFRQWPVRSLVLTRLQATNEPLGLLFCAWSTRRRRFSAKELCLVRGVAAQAAIAISSARLFARAEESAVSRERMRVAGVLHDTLSRTFFSISLTLASCLHGLPDGSDVRRSLEEIRGETASMMRRMRETILTLSRDLGPTGSFPERVHRLLEQFQRLSGTHARFMTRGDPTSLTRQQEELLLLTLQEGLANVAKHANATGVEVRLDVRDDGLRFELTDNGIGPPVETVTRLMQVPGHLGLRLMRERIEGLGGRLVVGPNLPSGFRLRGRLPMPVGAACRRSAS